MKHWATPPFWTHYEKLPSHARELADKAFVLLERDARHPSLHLKKIGVLWSARVSRDLRVLALEEGDGLHWLWIGSHDEYDRLIR